MGAVTATSLVATATKGEQMPQVRDQVGRSHGVCLSRSQLSDAVSRDSMKAIKTRPGPADEALYTLERCCEAPERVIGLVEEAPEGNVLANIHCLSCGASWHRLVCPPLYSGPENPSI